MDRGGFEQEDVPHKSIVVPGAGHGLEGEKTRAMVLRETNDWFDRHRLPEKE